MNRPVVIRLPKTARQKALDAARRDAADAWATKTCQAALDELEGCDGPHTVEFLKALLRAIGDHLVKRLGPIDLGLLLIGQGAHHLPRFEPKPGRNEADRLFKKAGAA